MGRYNNGSGLFTAAEFKNRGVIKLAPDALVYINGSFGTTVIAPVSGASQNTDFQEGISSINIQNNVEPPGSSSAIVEIVTPRYDDSRSSFWVDYKDNSGGSFKFPVLVPMMEIQIFLKGRFLVGNNPQYYPAFWGLIFNVEENYSGGMWKLNLQCVDMLHWWEWLTVAMKPGVKENYFVDFKQPITAFGTIYDQSNPFEIIYSLCQAAGFEAIAPPNIVDNKPTIITSRKGDWTRVLSNTLTYWNNRFKQQASYLIMYGATGRLIQATPKPGQILQTQDVKSADDSKQATRNSTQIKMEIKLEDIDGYASLSKVFFVWSEMRKNLNEAEYWTRLQVATELKNRVDYEFFQDVNGYFIFKPPFYNMNVKNTQVYEIKPQDIINYSSVLNTDEVVTVVEAVAGWHQQLADANKSNHIAYHADIDLMKKFGYKKKTITPWYLGGRADILQSYCASHLSVCNAKAHSATVTMPGRPEMRLGYPVYIPHCDSFYYVKSINHTFDFGGSFITGLSLEAERRKEYDSNNNVLKSYIYKMREGSIPEVLNPESPTAPKTTPNDAINKYQRELRNVGIVKSMEPGFYEVVQNKEIKKHSFTRETIPYTDEEGYKVIGGFPYGRDIDLKAGGGLESAMQRTAALTVDEANNNRQAQTVVNIRPVSEAEGLYMDDFFKQSDRNNVESFVPQYFKFPGNGGSNPDTATAAYKQTNMTPKKQGSPVEAPVPLVNQVG